MFRPLADPDCDLGPVAQVLAEAIKQVWIGPWLDHQKVFVLDLALDTLASGRRITQALPLLNRALSRQFDLVPWHLQAVRAAIDVWLRRRLL